MQSLHGNNLVLCWKKKNGLSERERLKIVGDMIKGHMERVKRERENRWVVGLRSISLLWGSRGRERAGEMGKRFMPATDLECFTIERTRTEGG